jgi:hypothetical protein
VPVDGLYLQLRNFRTLGTFVDLIGIVLVVLDYGPVVMKVRVMDGL